MARTRFDIDERAKCDAFCASVALAAQRLTPEERKALRENNEAWWLDAKLGNKRNRPVTVVKNEAPAEPSMPQMRTKHPVILSQEWDAGTRVGKIEFVIDSGLELEAAMEWLTGEYLPEYCRTLGAVVSADDPSSTSSAVICQDAPVKVSESSYILRFLVED